MIIEGSQIKVPGAVEGSPDEVLVLKDIQVAESRHGEVAFVTPLKAPELLVLFNKAWSDAERYCKRIAAVSTAAQRALDKRKARILLYEVEPFLKEKGVGSTKDTRDAVVVLDPEHQAIQERLDQHTAVVEFMKGKMKFFENAFTSVKKIMGEDAYNMSTRINNPNLSGGGNQKPFLNPTPTQTPTNNPPKTGYGKSRYDR